MAVGDISGDGKADVLVGQGWYEQPASDPWSSEWAFHPDWDLHASLPMIVVDLDQDGDNDLILGEGHDYGLSWWENQGPKNPETGKEEKETTATEKEGSKQGALVWVEHDIDKSFSQPHTLAWVDITGDQMPELITGKRYYAHNGKDPGGNEMPCLYYYTWDGNTRQFTRHTIDEGHVGVGLQIVAQDLNGDGKTDIAVAGKSGTYLIEAK